jgi:malonate-semialdehyde dehydrogenase (acetylating)/methylmalonate-semialdehyde dehydrogenase
MAVASGHIRIRNFIDGAWVEATGGKHVDLFNPSTGEVIGEVPMSDTQAVEAATASAHAAYPGWRATSIGKRMEYLFAIRAAMDANEEELARAIAVDQGKHISEARGEVRRVIQLVETACGIPTLIQGETLNMVSNNIVGRVIKEPLGVFGGVAPFNFPALVFGWFVPFAIGTGNTFVFKPSTQSPWFMQKMGEIFMEIGLPKGVVNIVHGNRDVPGQWYPDPRIAGVCLVGSTPTAKVMAEACGRHGKRSMLLGGAKNYLLVMEDAQIDLFLQNFLNSCYGSTGQRCLAGSVVAVVPEVYDAVVAKMVEASKTITVGDAMDDGVYMGPLVSAKAKATVEDYIEKGLATPARLVLDGRHPDVPAKNKNGYFVGPTIFTEVTPCNILAREEIFGPVVSVVRIQNLEHGLELIRQQPFGNGACIFTQNLYYAEKFIAEADVGMVGVNIGVPAPHPYLPFGGIKDSLVGTNKVQGKDGIDFFTQNKIASIRFMHPKGEAAELASRDARVRSCVAG